MSEGTTPVAGDIPASVAPSAEYVERMTTASLGDPVIAQPQAGPQRPEWLPEQFFKDGKPDTEALAKSYAELRAKMDAGKAAEPAAEADPKDPNAPLKSAKVEKPAEGETTTEATPLVSAMNAMREAFVAGDVGEDHIKAVEEAGVPREYIDIYMAGVEALAEKATAEVYSAAGGQEQFQAALQWAGENLSDADLDYYNTHCDVPSSRRQAVEWLMAKYTGSRPASEGTLLDARPASASGDVFNSQHEVTAAMASPDYKQNPAFRQQVAEKLLRSQRAGTLNTTATYHTPRR